MTTLNDLPIGKTATVAAVGGEGSLRQHFLDMGIIPLVDVTMVKHAPMGDPLEVRIHSYELTLRRDEMCIRDRYEAAGGIPAISEVKFSLTSNRGCFGECSFCALTFLSLIHI